MTETAWLNTSGTLHDSSGLLEPGRAVRLKSSHCVGCDRWEFPARSYCPTCGQTPAIEPLSGTAEIVGFSAVLHQPPGSLVEAPYAVALAAFPEGVAVLGTVEGADHRELRIGEAVSTVARQVGGSIEYTYRVHDRS